MKEENTGSGPDITKEEVKAIKQTKNNKADQMPVEIIKMIEEEQIEILVDLYNSAYSTGIIPKVWLTSTFIALPKKKRVQQNITTIKQSVQ